MKQELRDYLKREVSKTQKQRYVRETHMNFERDGDREPAPRKKRKSRAKKPVPELVETHVMKATNVSTVSTYVKRAPSPHGTSNRYNNNSCRCKECKDAWAAACRDYYRRKLARPVQLQFLLHGIPSRYRKGCRCDECKSASRQARAVRRRRASVQHG